jgi:hypothetical protein
MDDFFGNIQAGSKSKATIENYKRREKNFILWLKEDSPDCWDNEDDIFPDIHKVNAAMMCKFISVQSIDEKTGKMRSFSTPEGHHSMFVNLFSRLKVPLPDTFEREWIEFSKGYRNKIAEDISAGRIPTAGTDKLTFKDYKILTSHAVKSNTFYAHGFLVLAWNLMTRSGSTGDIKYEHLRMNGDHIIVVIPRHKGDRCGEKPTEKSLYSNPTCPQICPFLVLGIVVLSREVHRDFDSIILGTKADENINIWLKNASVASIAGTEGAVAGVNGAHLTSHCTRKGSTSYVVSLPGLSNVIACWLRAGWQLGGVLPKYISVEDGGDQTVGRTVCGLPSGELDFTLLPARFKLDAIIIWPDIVSNYNSYPEDFRNVIPYLVAALVHHAIWIKDNLPENHPLFLSRCWRSAAQVSLKPFLLPPCRMTCQHTGMVATGIPPLHVFMNQQQNNSTAIMSAIESQNRLPVAESRSPIGNNSELLQLTIIIIFVKFTALQFFTDMRFDRLESLLLETMQASRNSAAIPTASSSSSATSRVREVLAEPPLTWQYGGKLHRVPEGFRLLTKISLQVLYQLCNDGINSERIGPFKHLDGQDVHMGDRKHLSSAKALVTEIDKFLPEGFRSLSSSDRDTAFKLAFNDMALSFMTTEDRENPKKKHQKILLTPHCTLNFTYQTREEESLL